MPLLELPLILEHKGKKAMTLGAFALGVLGVRPVWKRHGLQRREAIPWPHIIIHSRLSQKPTTVPQ